MQTVRNTQRNTRPTQRGWLGSRGVVGALEAHQAALLSRPWVSWVGVDLDARGTYVVVVYVTDTERSHDLPGNLDGYPVVVRPEPSFVLAS